MANGKSKPKDLWISPIAAASVKVFEVTLGRLPSCGSNFRLVNGLPYVQLSPLLQRMDFQNLIFSPFFSVFSVTTCILIFNLKNLTAIQIMQLLVQAAGLLWFAYTSLVRFILKGNNELVYQINFIFQSNPTNASEDSQLNNKQKIRSMDLSGIFLLAVIIILNILGTPTIIPGCHFGLGPIHATTEQILHYQSTTIIFLLESLYNTILFNCVILRESFILLFMGVTFFNRIDANLIALGTYPLQNTEFVCSRYKVLQCRYLRICDDISILTGYTILITQVVLCACTWLVINGRRLLPMFVVFTGVAFFIGCLVIMLVVIKTQSNCRIFSENLVQKHVNGFRVYGIKGGPSGSLRRMWRCQLHLRVYCGKHVVIGRDAIMNYLDVFSSNATNLMVLVKV